MNDLSYIASLLLEKDDFTLIAHVSPDGDTLGSSLALYHALSVMGKKVQIVCQNEVPMVYAYLPGSENFRLPEKAEQTPYVICVDCAAVDRLGTAEKLFRGAMHTVNIDHHATNVGYADDNCVRDTAAAGEIVFDLLEILEQIDADSASCLYTAIMTDTGNFAYSNTTSDTLRIAAELLEDGADNERINRYVYRTVPLRKAKLLGIALNSLELHCNGKLGVIRITQEDLRRAGASSEDTEGVIDHVRDIDTVELALMIREAAQPDTGKISMRSKVYADVSAIAERMGGGGHKHAAGYTDYGKFSDICTRAIDIACAALNGEQASL